MTQTDDFDYRARFVLMRKTMGWTQKEAADKLGISYRTVQQFEEGITPFRKVYLLALRHLALLGDIP